MEAEELRKIIREELALYFSPKPIPQYFCPHGYSDPAVCPVCRDKIVDTRTTVYGVRY